jgi:hypothetical protein
MKRRPWFLILLAALCTLPATAQAHFMWLVVSGEAGKQRLEVYFSESAAPDNAELLAKLQSAKGVALHNGKALALEFKLSETSPAMLMRAMRREFTSQAVTMVLLAVAAKHSCSSIMRRPGPRPRRLRGGRL